MIDDLDLPPEQDCPPEIVTATAERQTTFVQNIRVDPEGTGSSEFAVEIRDCSPTQRLEVKWVLDLRPDTGEAQFPLRPGENVDAVNRADYTFTLQHADLRGLVNECHRLHMLVSSEFQLDTLRPVDPEDLDVATWLLAINDTNDDTIEVDCGLGGRTP